MSSFRKRNVQKPIPGTRTSAQTGQIITSSGNPSLDVLLGGGLPIGSICLIEEDKYVTHSKVLAKYFLAEGIASLQSVFLGSLDDDPTEMLRKLPKPLNEDEIQKEKAEDAAGNNEDGGDGAVRNGLRIAWRYNDLPLVNSEQTTTKIGHHFNLLEQIDARLLDYAETAIWNDKPNSAVEGDERVEGNASGSDDDDTAEEKAINILFGDNAINIIKEDEHNLLNSNSSGSAGGGDISDVEMQNAKNSATDEGAIDVMVPAEVVTTTMTAGDADSSFDALDMLVHKSDEESSLTTPTPTAWQKLKLFENVKYLRILNEIQPLLRDDKFTSGTLSLVQKGLCRVCITSLGSPLWYDDEFPNDILKFFTILRAAVRSVVAVCFITMPMHLVAKRDESLVAKIRNLVDFSIELESFAGSERETNPVFKDYSGLLHIRKLTAVNTLNAYVPETFDLAFKLRRKKFVIEKLHLPPELQESSNDDAAHADLTTVDGGCSGGGGASSSTALKATMMDF